MRSLPFSTTNLDTSNIEAICKIFDRLQQKFEVSYELDLNYQFASLELFKNRKINIGPAIKITNSFESFHLAFLYVGYSYAYSRKYSYSLTYEYQTWGIINLRKDFGHILIKPETLIDKIHELIKSIEIDFPDDPEFSKKYFVVTNDETKARSSMSSLFREQIKRISMSDFVLEIRGDKLIIGNRKIIEPDSAIDLVNFMDSLSKEPTQFR